LTVTQTTVGTPSTSPAPAPVTIEAVDSKKLETLTRAAEQPTTAPAETKPANVDLEKANEKLSSLLGKTK
jgi:hypothetical protein